MPVEQHGPALVIDARPALEFDEVSQAWLTGLGASGPAHERCVGALQLLLLRVARYEVSRRAGALRLHGPELEDIAQQASDDAVMAVRVKAPGFRGDSRFTTWAYKFVMFEVSTKMARHFWRQHRATMDEAAWERLPDTAAIAPDRFAEQRELLGALNRAIGQDLTQLQRRVFVAIVVNSVPMDALARELGSTRNAVYKVMFDARRRLRLSLANAGYDVPTPTRTP
jgi:RNA polymerase sigma-70 factor (ECF subfamily)